MNKMTPINRSVCQPYIYVGQLPNHMQKVNVRLTDGTYHAAVFDKKLRCFIGKEWQGYFDQVNAWEPREDD